MEPFLRQDFNVHSYRNAVGFHDCYRKVDAKVRAIAERHLPKIYQPAQITDGVAGRDLKIPRHAQHLVGALDKISRLRPKPSVDRSRENVPNARNVTDGSSPPERSNDPMLQLLDRLDANLEGFVGGRMSGVDIIFPRGDQSLWTALHHGSAIMSQYSAAAAALLANLSRPGQSVIEVGGGTGAGAAKLLDDPRFVSELLFTDVTQAFLAPARRRFTADPRVTFGLFDIDRTADEQGMAGRQFDFVLAVNTLHVAQDIERSIRNLTGLLAPGGRIVLGEGGVGSDGFWRPEPLFCVLEGWWNVELGPRRPRHGFLRAAEWSALMAQNGLKPCEFAAEDYWSDDFGGALAFATPPLAGRV